MRASDTVILKITGEILKDDTHHFSSVKLEFLTNEIKSIHGRVGLGIVIGGGNIVRGRHLIKSCNTTPVIADHIGMTATVLNGLLIEDSLKRRGVETRLLSAISIDAVAEKYVFKRAMSHLEQGRVVILAGGTGNSGVTTDTAAVIRAYELQACMVLKGTKVNGVYSADPLEDADAEFLPSLTYQDFLLRNLSGILDDTAVSEAKAKKIPIRVFNIFTAGNLNKAISGESVGSLIS